MYCFAVTYTPPYREPLQALKATAPECIEVMPIDVIKPEAEKQLMRPESVARDIVSSIYHHRHVRVIDARYRVLTFFWRLIPNWIWRRMKI